MIIEKIRTKLVEKGFQKVEVNVKGIYLLYHTFDNEINIFAIFDFKAGTEFTYDQFKNIQAQLYKNYSEKGFTSIHIQAIICTDHVEAVRNLTLSGRNVWIIDTLHVRLIIYEDQNPDFVGTRSELEDILLSLQISGSGAEPFLNSPDEFRENAVTGSFWTKYFAKCNTFLVLLNILVFFIIERGYIPFLNNGIVDAGALYWPAIKYKDEYYRLFTYMFLHGGMEHLANNMIVLLIIGDNVERASGKWRYLLIYFGSGIIAGIASMSYNMVNNLNTISIGASGAIFGVVGAMAYIVAVNKGRLEDISTRQIILFVIFSLYGGLTSQGVDNAAHIGGLLAGIVLAAILYRKHKKKEPERG
ncbi:rhomboid family intramembrane serine protease [Anaerocolumna sedimenticola]|uniref:Rhomboid family intramembrane serine protease n=1 Tax=Anaerocolumna sedimenticola TaxID=2696063 RepID=A0A6P1TIV6_9FIRM|nr:rhomboid family intramembrane serine protease [Anaerocolumna sedimenticola]QHQ60237.1 rhomboid family intramembrane serine protease [Anaerocolumna sedimenticola]